MFDITQKRVAEISDLPIKNPNGSPMINDDNGNPVTATCFGPGTKIWQVADAARRRKAIKRSREANGKFEATVDNELEDMIEFLCKITKRFNNLPYADVTGDSEIVTAIYNDLQLGFIRDHMIDDTKSWENFMKASATLTSSTQSSSLG